MNPEARVAYIHSQTICAMAEIEGMKADNLQKQIRGEYPIYGKEDFENVPARFGVHHNQVIEYLRG